MEILKLLAVAWRRRWVLSGSLLFFLTAAVLALFVLPESWEAETQVLAKGEDATTSILNELGLSEMAMSLTTDDIQNKIYLVTSEPVVDEVIWRLQLRDRKGKLYEPEDIAGGGLISTTFGVPAITVEQVQGTDVLTITATAPSAEAARLMADTTAAVYITQTTERDRAEIREAQKFLREQLDQVTRELDQAFARIAEAQVSEEVIDLDSEVRAAVSRLSELMLERETTRARIEETRARIGSVRRLRGEESSRGVSATSMTSNPVIGQLRSRLTEQRARRQSMVLDVYTAKAPEVQELDHQITATEDELKSALAESFDLDPTVGELRTDLVGQQRRLGELEAAVKRTTHDFAIYPDKMRRISQLQLAADAAETVYKSLQDQRYEIGIAEAMTMADVRVVSPARLPDSRANPKALFTLLAATLLGLGLGAGSALALEYVDDSLKLAEDVREIWPLPQLGLLPTYDVQVPPALARLPATDPLFEAHRAIRNAISFATLDQPPKVLAITSSAPSEGKSTVAVNLALSLVQEGKRVLLIDADLRLPTQHRQFAGLAAQPGLVEVLGRRAEVDEVVQSTPVPGLWLLSAGELPPDPGRLIESLRMRHVLVELGKRYDAVVVDTPPVLAVTDPLNVARMVDAVVLVVELHQTTRRMLAEVRERFEAAQCVPVGIVLNKVPRSSVGYGDYSRYYQRQRQAQPSAHTGAA